MGRDVLFDFMAEHYTASRLLLCAAGAVEHDTLVSMAKKKFDGLQQGGLNPLEPAVFKGGESRDERELEQVHFALALPALMRAEKLQKRAARIGFDWYDTAQVIEKISEELSEIGEEEYDNGASNSLRVECGDLLFACVNLLLCLIL